MLATVLPLVGKNPYSRDVGKNHYSREVAGKNPTCREKSLQ